MSEQLLIKAFMAAADIKPRHAIKLTANGVAHASSADDVMIGISHQQLSVSKGMHADVVMVGIIQAHAGAAFPINAKLTADANGKLIQATAGKQAIAIALEEATSADEYVRVLINPSIA